MCAWMCEVNCTYGITVHACTVCVNQKESFILTAEFFCVFCQYDVNECKSVKEFESILVQC